LLRGNSGEGIDEVVVTHFGEGRSFTGEATIEISCHGSPVLVSTILKELVFAGCRMARPGEFTYRAFMNGRLDLVQAESVLGLIESRSRQSAKVALRQLQGHLSVDFGRIEDDVVWILAQLEANIDFSAEGLEVTSPKELLDRGKKASEHVRELIASYSKGRLLRDGIQIALVGKPNAGKSSLMNALLKEERSIVTADAGTTRDLVEGRLSIGGLQVTFVDTAGLREAENEAERIGVQRSMTAMDRSDHVFFVIDLSAPSWREDLRSFLGRPPANAKVLFNKIDLDRSDEWRAQAEAELEVLGTPDVAFWVSASTGRGLGDVEAYLRDLVKSADSEASNVIIQARHLEQ
ncbi:MAG: tRNA uridine-5-carboxymethylaminomethyl(34) synthesis GTPase MnmE, partial [Bdellovibrionota bacterium]